MLLSSNRESRIQIQIEAPFLQVVVVVVTYGHATHFIKILFTRQIPQKLPITNSSKNQKPLMLNFNASLFVFRISTKKSIN